MRTVKRTMLGSLVAVALLAGGCIDNSLDLTNPNDRTVETFWATEADAIAATDAVYASLYANGLYGRNRYWMWGRTDTYMSRSPAANIQSAVRGVISDYNYTGFLSGMWNDPWQGIFRANQVIEKIPAMEIDTALKDRLVAEAKFLRALFHFEQVLLFGSVPIITEVLNASSQPTYSEPAAVYAQVVLDATEAAASLPWRHTGTDVGRATRGGALALAAEAHMHLGQWDQAVTKLQQIVSSGQYSLLPNYGGLFRLEQGENSVESLFEVTFGDVNQASLGARGNQNPRLVGPSTGTGSSVGFNDVQPTQWAFEQFFAEAGRSYPNNPDPRLQYSIFWNAPGGMDVFGMPFHLRYATTGPGGGGGFRETDLEHTYFFKKYQEYWRTGLSNFHNPINVKVYRYGQVLLMLAEALTETNQVQAAETPLNLVRARVNLGPVPTGMSRQQMEDWINREHVLELFWEHRNRISFLKRQGLYNKEYLGGLAPGIGGQMIARNPFHASVFVNGKSELIPIPQEELDRNPMAQERGQNPGW